MRQIEWANSAKTAKVFGLDVWVLIPIVPSLIIWNGTLFMIGAFFVLVFAILGYLGYTVPASLRVLRCYLISNKKKKKLFSNTGRVKNLHYSKELDNVPLKGE